jgi:tetratricopeptide (TPR) repeat protein
MLIKPRLLWLVMAEGHYPFYLINLKARLLMSVGQWQESERLYRGMLAALDRLEDGLPAATVKNQLGYVLLQKGEGKEALPLLEEVYRHDLENGYEEEAAKPLLNMGNIHKNIGDYTRALEHYRLAVELGQGNGDLETVALAWGNIGLVEWYRGEYEEALGSVERAMALARESGNIQQIGIAHGTIGNIQYSTGRFREALESYRRQMEIARNIGDKYSLRVALNNMGAIHDVRGEYAEEKECFLLSLEIARQLGNRAGERVVLGNLGGVCVNTGELEAAGDYFRKSLELAEDLGDRRGIGITFYNLGLLASMGGDHRGALSLFSRALPVLEELKAKDFWCLCLLRRSEAEFATGERVQAINSAEKALTIAMEVNQGEAACQARILLALIEHRIGRADTEEAKAKILAELQGDDEALKARVRVALFRLTGSEENRGEARAALTKLLETTPKHEYRLMLDSLI